MKEDTDRSQSDVKYPNKNIRFGRAFLFRRKECYRQANPLSLMKCVVILTRSVLVFLLYKFVECKQAEDCL